MYLVLSAFTSRPISLLAATEASVFLYSRSTIVSYSTETLSTGPNWLRCYYNE